MLTLLLSLLMSSASASEVDALIRQRAWTEATTLAGDLAADQPGDLAAQELWIDLLLSLGRAEEATKRYAAQLILHPDDADLHYLLGRAATDIDTTRRHYHEALRVQPHHPRATMGLGALWRAEGNLREAAAAYEAAVTYDPKLEEAWAGLIACFAEIGDREATRLVATSAVLTAPATAEAWLVLAGPGGAPGEAEAALEKAVVAAPEDARLWTLYAEMKLRQGDGAAALRGADNALRLDPPNAAARLAKLYATSLARGTLKRDQLQALIDARADADPARARAALDALVRDAKQSPLPWMSRAGLRAKDDPAGARSDLEKALSLDPKNDEVQAALGRLLLEQGDPKAAGPLLRAASAARPDDASLAIAAAEATWRAGDREAGERAMDDAARRHPLDALVPLAHAHLYELAGDNERAYQLVRDGWARLPDVRLYLALAIAAARSNRLDEAIRIYDDLAERTRKPEFTVAADALRARRDAP